MKYVWRCKNHTRLFARLTSSTGTYFSLTRTTTLTNSAGLQTAYISSAVGGTWYVTDVQGAGCSSCSTRGTIHNDYDYQGNLLDTIDQLNHLTSYTHDVNPQNRTPASMNSHRGKGRRHGEELAPN